MLMPETPVNKNYFLLFLKNDVRVSRKAPTMNAIAITHAMQEAPDLHFRSHVLAANAPHVGAAAFDRNCVYHSASNYQI